MDSEFMQLLVEIEKEKGISHETLLEALEQALVSAYKKSFVGHEEVRVTIDRETAEMKVYTRQIVVDEVLDPLNEISLETAKKINKSYQLGDFVDTETMPATFGRIAAQTARQVVVQRLREAERGLVYEKFIEKQGEIITGMVQRLERRNMMVDIGGTEAILTPSEQVPGEVFRQGDRIKVYVSEVSKTNKGPQVKISRSHPDLVRRLFELEVPEIQNEVVLIKSIAREAGSRTKIAVCSEDENIDPIGACVGAKGARIQRVTDELRKEKVDVISYNEDPNIFVASALNPAKVTSTYAEEETRICHVVVPDDQLSLAIGKEGQNVRLAAKLTGWKIDIKSESAATEE